MPAQNATFHYDYADEVKFDTQELEMADIELEQLQEQLKSLEQVVTDLQNDLLINLPHFLQFT